MNDDNKIKSFWENPKYYWFRWLILLPSIILAYCFLFRIINGVLSYVFSNVFTVDPESFIHTLFKPFFTWFLAIISTIGLAEFIPPTNKKSVALIVSSILLVYQGIVIFALIINWDGTIYVYSVLLGVLAQIIALIICLFSLLQSNTIFAPDNK